MDAELRIIRLIRKAAYKNGDTADKDAANTYSATDYFDTMQVSKVELEAPFAKMMGIWPIDKPDVSNIVAQSYSLYCSKEMILSEEGRSRCGDPFSMNEANSSRPFLSVIQVHIMPEILAYALSDKATSELLDIVYGDLCEALEGYSKKLSNENYILRIYRMLSAGDFAIVVRSRNAEVSFRISSMLRSRRISEGQVPGNINKLVLYKTYTLLTLQQEVISQDADTTEPRFVLRCCFSNRYWRQKSEMDRFMESRSLETECSEAKVYGLNGRYDLTFWVSETQFLDLYESIQDYRQSGVLKETVKCPGEGTVSIVEYIKYLMSRQAFSYINIRYLVAQEKEISEDENSICSTRITVSAEDLQSKIEYLDEQINKFYASILQKYYEAREELKTIGAYRKNMDQYVELLEKLVALCYGINDSSDTRIYAAILLEQLDSVFDSVVVYANFYQKSVDECERSEILDALEDCIRQSVWALNSYAQYIRNNNLQSLQTPNYNIESSMSMEKLLIGYGELLFVFMKFYRRKYYSALTNKRQNKERMYLPIVIPALFKSDMSVDVLFMEGVMNDWRVEESIWNEQIAGAIRHCMVVSVPTLMELTDVGTMVVSLFYEVAHQFRYERRSDRNDALYKYLIHVTMSRVAEKVTQKLQRDAGCYDWDKELQVYLENSLSEAYGEIFMRKEDPYFFSQFPLSSFNYCMQKQMFDNLNYEEGRVDLKTKLQEYMQDIKYYCNLGDSKFQEIMKALEKISPKDNKNICNQMICCAYSVALEGACQSTKIVRNKIWSEAGLGNWIIQGKDFDARADWDRFFLISSQENLVCEKMWHLFNDFSGWICDNSYQIVYGGNDTKRRQEDFFKEAYNRCCAKWQEREERKDWRKDPSRKLEAMGRLLGIDQKLTENFKAFKKEIKPIIQQNLVELLDGVEWRIGKYREETADLLMCNALKLSPFGYVCLLAINLPIDTELSDEYISRCVNVLILCGNCIDSEAKVSESAFITICAQMVKQLEDSLKALGINCRKESCEVIWQSQNQGNEERKDALLSRMDKISIPSLEDEKLYSLLRNIKIIIKNAILFGQRVIQYLNDYVELREDYQRGAEKLKNLNEDMCNDVDPMVQNLGRFCKKIGELQNNLLIYRNDVNKQITMNEESIFCLLNMYYQNKRRTAQKMRGKSDIGKGDC